MARNRGKRPGTSSGPRPQNADQARNSEPTTAGTSGGQPSDKAATPGSTSASQTHNAEGKSTGGVSKPPSTSVPSASAKSEPAGKSESATQAASPAKTDTRPVGKPAPTSSSKADTVKKPAAAAAGAGPSVSGASASSSGTGGGSGFWPGLLGGLIGGAAMAISVPLFWGGGGDRDALMQLQSTTTELDSRLSATESQVQDVGSLAERVAAVEEAPAPGDAGSTDLAQRLTDLEQQLSALDDSSTGSAGASDNTAVDERLAALESQLSELNGTVGSFAETQQSAAQAVTALQGALPAVEATLSSTGETVEQVGQQTAALSESVDALRQTTDSLGADLGDLSGRVEGAETKLDHIGGEYQRAAAMVVAIGDVDRAIAKAEPYETALESLRALGQDDPSMNAALETLQPMSAKGVPTAIDLKASFGEVGSRILLAEEGDGTLVDQVSDNLFGIINMRPAGAAVEGDNSRAIVARAQAKLSADDFEGTVAELEGLNESAAASAADWVADVKARLSADAAVADLRAHAQSLLAKGS